MEEWIRIPSKERSNCSIIWKATIKSFHMVGEGLAWRVGNGTKVRIGSDPWPGGGINHILPISLIGQLHTQGFYHLNQIVDPVWTSI